jgi:tetratricopeptide (TPR) repeat protein
MSSKPAKQNTHAHTAGSQPLVAAPGQIPRWLLPALLIFTALVYSHALQNGLTFDDDDVYILKNPYIRNFSFAGIKDIFTSFYAYNYHPLTSLVMLGIYKISGTDPFPYHFINVALHIANTWLVFTLISRLCVNRLTAFVVAALFALHPMHVESVAWAAELKDVLYSFFYLSSAILYLRWQQLKVSSIYLSSLLLFLAALLSKSAAVTLPLLFIAFDLYRERRFSISLFIEKLPFFVLSLVFGILAVMSQKAGGAINDLSVFYNPLDHLFLFTSGLAAYFLNLAAPVQLSALHYFPPLHNGMLPWYHYLSLPFIAIIIWLVAKPNRFISAIVTRRDWLFGMAFFLITISVMLQIVTVGSSFYAERYSYISYIGFFFIIGRWLSRKRDSGAHTMVIATLATVLVLCAAATWSRIEVWRDTDTLFADIIEKNQGNALNYQVYNAWAESEKMEGRPAEALEKYNTVIQINPNYHTGYAGRGQIREKMGNIKGAIEDYNKAIALKPEWAMGYNYRGWAMHQVGEKKLAMADFNKAIALDPRYAEPYNNRGWTAYESGDTAAAMADFSKAIALAPTFPLPYYNRASIKANTGDSRGAINDYDLLIAQNPTDSLAYFNRGLTRLNINDKPGACQDLNRARELGYMPAAEAMNEYCR